MFIKKLLILLLIAVLPTFSSIVYSVLPLAGGVELSMNTKEYSVLVRRGLDIYITVGAREGYDEIIVIARSWIKPIDVEWEKFKTNYYYPKKDLWESDLLGCIKETFSLWFGNFEIIDRGINDSSQEVHVIIRFYLRDSFSFQVLHTTLGISFADVFKLRGKGWIDEVRVRSDIYVHSWTPEPTSQSHNEFVWVNPSMEAAPDYYWLEIEPICIILVVIGCLPSNHMVNVFVNGKLAGAINGGD